MSVAGRDRFDLWMEQQVRTIASAHSGPSPRPAQARYQAAQRAGGHRMSVLAKAAALVSTKAAIGVAVAAAAVGAAGAGEAVVTRSMNPLDWGHQLVQQAEKCAAALMPASHGSGDCLGTFTPQSGGPVSSDQPNGTNAPRSDHTPGPPAAPPGAGQPSGTPGQGAPGGHPDKGQPGHPADGPPPGKPSPPPSHKPSGPPPNRPSPGGPFGPGGPPNNHRK